MDEIEVGAEASKRLSIIDVSFEDDSLLDLSSSLSLRAAGDRDLGRLCFSFRLCWLCRILERGVSCSSVLVRRDASYNKNGDTLRVVILV
ncbi:hypothetical protein MLD38_016186 [Melastoma candidum]|uniref:Uncharacterized protein n=1 Tax=Melastoma candidum TaxID=119954 RepID=A0ACB9RIR8_9MYRT|nr:hypothetical protein MLD38_016186 [Melastoma candidum]